MPQCQVLPILSYLSFRAYQNLHAHKQTVLNIIYALKEISLFIHRVHSFTSHVPGNHGVPNIVLCVLKTVVDKTH